MLNLIFDTETTGFPHSKRPVDAIEQPYLVQLAVLITKGDEIIRSWDCIVKCPIHIPEDAMKVHGITTEIMQEKGVNPTEVIETFHKDLLIADRVICHNADFDLKIMSYAYHRAGKDFTHLKEMARVCTMKTAAPSQRLLGKRKSLSECYEVLVDSAGFSDAHTASADTMACWKVFRELERRGVELK